MEQGTFPTPIGANQTNLAPGLDVPGNVVQDRYASEGFGDVFCAEQRHRNQSKHSDTRRQEPGEGDCVRQPF